MKRTEFIAEAKALGIPSDAYCFDGLGTGECYCVEIHGDGWMTFYSERGQRQGIRIFTNEDDANEHLLATLRRVFKK